MSDHARDSREAWNEKVAVLIYDAHYKPHEAEALASSMMNPSPRHKEEEPAPTKARDRKRDSPQSSKGPGKGGDTYRASREELKRLGY